MNLVAHESQLSVTGVLSTYGDTGDDGVDTVYVRRHFCGACGSPIVSDLVETGGIIAVKAGTLDEKSGIRPTVEAWCESKQPWVDLPGMEISLDRE